MQIVFPIMVLIITVIVSEILTNLLPKIPVMFIQIILGVGLAVLPIFSEFEIETEMFMLLVIAPLLFSDAQNTSRRELKEYIKPILSLALFLVVISVIIIGYVIHWTMPAITLGLAFILAAIITPTDMVAVKSLTKNLKMPKGIVPVLEGESLFNDASGLALFDVTLAAFLTGTFSLKEGVIHFFTISIGGLITGFIIGFIIIHIRSALAKTKLEEPTVLVLIQILTPFVVFMIAEQVHVSGILAVVAAGIIHGLERDRFQLTSTKIRVINDSATSVVNYVLNGFVFVLLGLTLVYVVKELLHLHALRIPALLLEGVLIYLFMSVLRFVWMQLIQPEESIKNIKAGPITTFIKRMGSNRKRGLIFSFSGIHGTIALAIAFAIPTALNDGTAFPMRNELLFLASVVVLTSLIVPTFVFPRLVEQINTGVTTVGDYKSEQLKMILYSIEQLQKNIAKADENTNIPAIQNVIYVLQEQSKGIRISSGERPDQKKMISLIKETSLIEKQTTESLTSEGRISKKVANLYYHYSLLSKKQIKKNFFQIIRLRLQARFFKRILGNSKRSRRRTQDETSAVISEQMKEARKQFALVYNESIKNVIDYLNQKLLTDASVQTETLAVLQFYESRRKNLPEEITPEKSVMAEQEALWYTKACQYMQIYLQDALENQSISTEVSNELRELIAYDQMVYLSNSS